MSRLAKWENKKLDGASLSGTLANLGNVLLNPCVVISFFNTTDEDVNILINPNDEALRLPSGATMTFDSRNVQNSSEKSFYLIQKGEQIQVSSISGSAGTTGEIIANILTLQLG